MLWRGTLWKDSPACVDRTEAAEERDYPQGGNPTYFDVGITNSAPLAMVDGQRCITDFCRV